MALYPEIMSNDALELLIAAFEVLTMHQQGMANFSMVNGGNGVCQYLHLYGAFSWLDLLKQGLSGPRGLKESHDIMI